MPAGRFRASRIRSPSWRNELNEFVIRQSPAVPGFFFLQASPHRKKLRLAKFLCVPRVCTGPLKDGALKPFATTRRESDGSPCPGVFFKLQLRRRERVREHRRVTLLRR